MPTAAEEFNSSDCSLQGDFEAGHTTHVIDPYISQDDVVAHYVWPAGVCVIRSDRHCQLPRHRSYETSCLYRQEISCHWFERVSDESSANFLTPAADSASKRCAACQRPSRLRRICAVLSRSSKLNFARERSDLLLSAVVQYGFVGR